MEFDPNNKVIQLCSQGMEAEFAGNIGQAHALFQQAWDLAKDDFEAFTAAHYLARHQEDPNEMLKWNVEALNRAVAIRESGIKEHFPSLYLNVARSHETLGNMSEAGDYYRLAADSGEQLPNTKYAEMIKSGISEGLKRTGALLPVNETVSRLIDGWCVQKNLKALAIVLPAWVGNLGSTNDMHKLISALSYLSASRSLCSEEQAIVEQVIIQLSGQSLN
jgi:hypothetical protein